MITKRNGNGQTECYGCKEKGKFALTWDSWLYNFNDKPYCFDCLMEKLEELDKENEKLKKQKEIIDKAINDLQSPDFVDCESQCNRVIQILEDKEVLIYEKDSSF